MIKSRSKQRNLLLALLAGGMASLAILCLGLTFWLDGFDPSLWFVITGSGHKISGETITVVLVSALVAGLSLLVLARHLERRRLESSRFGRPID
jgi:hypothetical protein